jgi:uncharacterized protein involved in exopolysaccharide biosynthesis
MDTRQTSQFGEDQIRLWEVFGLLWQAKLPIFSATLVLAGFAGLAAWWIPKSYRASVLLSPVVDSASQLNSSGSAISELGGVASLAGITIGADSKKSESIAVLQSEALTDKYIQENNLLPVLFKSRWDADKGRWKSARPDKIPTLWEANAFFKKSVRDVTTDTKTGLVTLSITWTDPHTAAKWANELVELTNDYLRSKAIAESERSIAFLNEQAAKTSIVEARQAIFKSLEGEIRKGMQAQGSKEYAFRVLDPAVAPEKPRSPLFRVWVLAGGLAGLIVSSGLVLSRAASHRN